MEEWRLKALADTGLMIILEEFGKYCTEAVAERYRMPTRPKSRTSMRYNQHFSKLLTDDGSARFDYVFSYPIPGQGEREHSTYIDVSAKISDDSLTIREIGVEQISHGPHTPGTSLAPNPHDKSPSGIDWDGLFLEWGKSEVGKVCMERYWGNITDYLVQTKQASVAMA
ncbi:MAG: hypothetical protein MJE68_05710 [Proteobacteria bacterium]|nr:hypothetical protein [Pseudomonadota bacterium]